MRHILGFILVVFLMSGFSSCYNVSIKKPAQLISKGKFVEVMVDMYTAQAIPIDQGADSLKKNVTQTDLYYSVLKKYQLADTVFIKSLIYYSSQPKEYEKLHEEIMNVLKEKETEFTPKDQLNAEDQ